MPEIKESYVAGGKEAGGQLRHVITDLCRFASLEAGTEKINELEAVQTAAH